MGPDVGELCSHDSFFPIELMATSWARQFVSFISRRRLGKSSPKSHSPGEISAEHNCLYSSLKAGLICSRLKVVISFGTWPSKAIESTALLTKLILSSSESFRFKRQSATCK